MSTPAHRASPSTPGSGERPPSQSSITSEVTKALMVAAITSTLGIDAHWYIAAAVFLVGVAVLSLRRARTAKRARMALRIVAIASLLAGVTVGSVGVIAHGAKPRHDEEALVSSLSAGQDFARFRQQLGAEDSKEHVGKDVIYEYDRPWEILRAAVDRFGTVVSYGVYAYVDEKSFHPLIDHGLGVRLNSSTLGILTQRSGDNPDEVVGRDLSAWRGCGAHLVSYAEGFDGDGSEDGRYFVLGSDDGSLCEGIGRCEPLGLLTLSKKLYRCLNSLAGARLTIRGLRVNYYVESAKFGTVVPEMVPVPDPGAPA